MRDNQHPVHKHLKPVDNAKTRRRLKRQRQAQSAPPEPKKEMKVSSKTSTNPPSPKRHIRRNKGDEAWFVTTKKHVSFIDTFRNGLLTDVEFVHNAPPMQCEYGYDSTGEAVGSVTKMITEMPADAKRTVKVRYDAERRIFHEKDAPDKRVDKADYLLLLEDGTAIAGWKQ